MRRPCTCCCACPVQAQAAGPHQAPLAQRTPSASAEHTKLLSRCTELRPLLLIWSASDRRHRQKTPNHPCRLLTCNTNTCRLLYCAKNCKDVKGEKNRRTKSGCLL